LVREVLQNAKIDSTFVRGKLFIIVIELSRLETAPVKDLSLLNSSLKKYNVHAVLSSGKFLGVKTLSDLLTLVKETENAFKLGNIKQSMHAQNISTINKHRGALQSALRSSF
jgi:hypothetical protein